MSLEALPSFVKRVLHVGEVRADTARRLCAGGAQLWAAPGSPAALSALPKGFCECLAFDAPGRGMDELLPLLRLALPALAAHGRLMLLSPPVFTVGAPAEGIEAQLVGLGLLHYASPGATAPAGAGPAHALQFVRRDYNPVAHARELAAQGRPDGAIEVLEGIPHDLIGNDRNLALIAAEKQHLYLEWQKILPPGSAPHRFLFQARREFAQATAALPHLHAAYRTQAEYWRRIGSPDMAHRTLRSVLHVAEDAGTRGLLNAQPADAPPAETPAETAPEWSGRRRPPKILVLTHDFSDYGMDCLYDGLCRVLGADQVVEYPWKPMLHGQRVENTNYYPCAFNHPSTPRTAEELIRDVGAGRFDLVVFADVVQLAHGPAVRRILEAARQLPLVLYDTWDDCYTPMTQIRRYLGGGSRPIDLIFKREVLEAVDYGAHVVPLPFGFSPPPLPEPDAAPRDLDVFWAGKAVWGLRPLCLPRVEAMLERRLDRAFPPKEYADRLRRSRIGLCFFGSGFDTVRYWEVPAYGAMLLAEKPPIRIPHDFKEGESAVLFADLPELEEKLRHYLAHPEQAERIAKAGQRLHRRHHTNEARARQFLGHLEERIQW